LQESVEATSHSPPLKSGARRGGVGKFSSDVGREQLSDRHSRSALEAADGEHSRGGKLMSGTALAFGRTARDVAGHSKEHVAEQRNGNGRIPPEPSGAGARRSL
jgi:hypothetical protein